MVFCTDYIRDKYINYTYMWYAGGLILPFHSSVRFHQMNYTHFEDGMYDNYQYLLNGGKRLWSKSFAFDFTKIKTLPL